MRLTLRTLLAYLDDMLEPAQAKLIGQKIAESNTAQELIERIRQVTRRRRITTPPPSGPGAKLDPNTIAEYLDNTIAAEQLGEVEEIFLASDVHLAEIAACHQILTLVLGEPALVPPTAKQRMYGLVKGPESIPFRKPPVGSYTPEGELVEENREADETLRMGIPVVGRGSLAARLAMVGGGALLGALLVLAIFQVLSGRKDDPSNQQLVHLDPDKDKKIETPKPEPEEKGTVEAKKDETPDAAKKEPDVSEKKDAAKTEPADVPFAAPSPKQVAVGSFVPPEAADVSILLQPDAKQKAWQRIGLKNPKVISARPLLSLPGCRSVVQLESGLRLILWGNLPEIWPSPLLLESEVELHQPDVLDADLTLHRGRIAIANSKPYPQRARVRFANPTNPDAAEFVDVTLEKGSEILCERWSYFSPSEPFYLDPKDPNRLGPTAEMAFIVVAGHIRFRTHDLSAFAMSPPPGSGLFLWNSQKGLNGPLTLSKLPEGATINPPTPPNADPKSWPTLRSGMLSARDQLGRNVGSRPVEVVLKEAMEAADSNLRKLAVRCYAALDDVGNLVDALEQEKHQDVRLTAIESLRHWMTTGRENEYKVYDLLAPPRYRNSEREKIMELLHGFTDKQWAQPLTYEILIDYLDNAKLPIRELAAWNLYQNPRLSAARSILYNGMAEPPARQAVQNQWRAFIAQMFQRQPPMPMGK